jgi:hypothetical protein
MQASAPYQASGGQLDTTTKLLTLGYFLACIIMSIFVIVNLALKHWVDYCFWYFGLVYGTSWSEIKHFDDEDNIDDVDDDACDDDYKNIVQSFCPHACRNIDNLQTAGQVMLAFGILSLLAHALVIMFHVVLFFKRELKVAKLIYVFDVLPAILWVLGVIIYGSVADFGSYDDTKDLGFSGDYAPDDLEYEAGFGFAVANCIFFPIVAAFGVLVSCKTISAR